MTTEIRLLRRSARFCCVILAVTSISVSALAQSPEDSLKIYAVNVVKTTPLQKPFVGDGIYLGRGGVLTAAHVIGRLGFLKDPHVLIGGQDLPATIIKEGSSERTDLTLLSVDETRLPISLRMRRNPLCKQPLRPGQNVVVVAPEKTVRSQIISPLSINPSLRKRYNSLISDAADSGSGVFEAERKCLAGIISRSVEKYEYQNVDGKIAAEPAGRAGYFVPASEIADFLPAEYRF